MKSVRLLALVLVATWSVAPLIWAQENSQETTKPSGTTDTKHTGKAKDESAALQREVDAIEARHVSLDEEIASWSGSLGRWMKEHNVTIDPAQVVLSLSSRSYLLHQSKHPDGAAGDAEYSRLEDQMKDIQDKRRKIDADWIDFLARDRASTAINHVKTVEKTQSFDFEFGDSTIPIPGISARQRCCSLRGPEAGCRLIGEWCSSKPGGKGWQLNCLYICNVVALP